MNKITGKCYNCQYEERKHEIGDMKRFEEAMGGNTVMGGTCEVCGEYKMILPYRDMDIAIRYSNKEPINPFEWD